MLGSVCLEVDECCPAVRLWEVVNASSVLILSGQQGPRSCGGKGSESVVPLFSVSLTQVL